MNWIPATEKMPPSGKVVLACYRNPCGMYRVIVGFWAAEKMIEASPEFDTTSDEYDESSDKFIYYLKEGWYERLDNFGDFDNCPVTEGTVTNWMPLPNPPEEV